MKKTIQITISILLIVVSFVVAVLAYSIDLQNISGQLFDFARMKTILSGPNFYFQVFIVSFFLEATYIGIYNARDAINKSSKKWTDLVGEYEKNKKVKENNPVDFKNCVRISNFQLKKEEYIKHWEKIRIKLQTKLDRVPNEKINGKYAAKLKQRIEYINNKFVDIDNRVLKSNIKYIEIRIEDFGSAIYTIAKSRHDMQNRQTIKFTQAAIYKFVSKFFWAVCGTAVAFSAYWQFDLSVGFWIIISACGIGCLTTTISAINIADKLHESEAVASLTNRNMFITEDFKSYMESEHKQTYEERFQAAVNAEIDKKIKAVEEKEAVK